MRALYDFEPQGPGKYSLKLDRYCSNNVVCIIIIHVHVLKYTCILLCHPDCVDDAQ